MKYVNKLRLSLFFIFLIFMFAKTCNAAFVENELQLQVMYPTIDNLISSPVVSIVGDSVEFINLDEYSLPGYIVADVEVDVSDTSITWLFNNSGGFGAFPNASLNGHVLTDISDSIPSISGVYIDPTISNFELDLSRIIFTENQIFLNVAGLSIDEGSVLKADVSFVPVPASLWLLLSGLGIIGRFRGKNEKKYRCIFPD